MNTYYLVPASDYESDKHNSPEPEKILESAAKKDFSSEYEKADAVKQALNEYLNKTRKAETTSAERIKRMIKEVMAQSSTQDASTQAVIAKPVLVNKPRQKAGDDEWSTEASPTTSKKPLKRLTLGAPVKKPVGRPPKSKPRLSLPAASKIMTRQQSKKTTSKQAGSGWISRN